jgi:hypothetical protein
MVWAICSETTAIASRPIASIALLALSFTSAPTAFQPFIAASTINRKEMAVNSNARTACTVEKKRIRYFKAVPAE